MGSERIVRYNGHPVIGFGEDTVVTPVPSTSSPWTIPLATSVVSAAAGWAIQEIARVARGGRR
jgi:hypothetical protein